MKVPYTGGSDLKCDFILELQMQPVHSAGQSQERGRKDFNASRR